MLTQQSTICGKYHGNTGYLLAETQEFVGMGNRVNDRQTRWTDKSQLMTSHRVTQVNHTNESHK